jgi:hypothetical protein
LHYPDTHSYSLSGGAISILNGLTLARTHQLRPGIALSAVSCPSVRNTLCIEFQPLFFQRSASQGWFLMGLLHLLVLRCAFFLCNFRHSRRHLPCLTRTVLFELS